MNTYVVNIDDVHENTCTVNVCYGCNNSVYILMIQEKRKKSVTVKLVKLLFLM